jgi:hypothetical protein
MWFDKAEGLQDRRPMRPKGKVKEAKPLQVNKNFETGSARKQGYRTEIFGVKEMRTRQNCVPVWYRCVCTVTKSDC